MVKVNGEERSAKGRSVLDILAEQGRDPKHVAVMLNDEILPKNEYGRVLADGDEVEIIGFVGGG